MSANENDGSGVIWVVVALLVFVTSCGNKGRGYALRQNRLERTASILVNVRISTVTSHHGQLQVIAVKY